MAEGLFFYLSEDLITATMRTAARWCAPLSLFAADVIGTAGLDSAAMRPYRDWCEGNGLPPPFGSDDPAALVRAGGWRSDRVTAPGAADANYGRLPAQPGGQVPGRTHLVTGELPVRG